MDSRKQLKRFELSPRRDGPLMLAIVGVFLAGMTAGGFIFAYESQPSMQKASSDGKSTLAFFLNGTSTTAR
jgi:hypothetical protein